MVDVKSPVEWVLSQNVFGAPFFVFLGILIFWGAVCFISLGENPFSIILSAVLSVLTAWLYGKAGWFLFTILAGVILIITIVAIILVLRVQSRSPASKPFRSPRLASASSQASSKRRQALRLYHGTSLNNALEIFTTGLWLVGQPTPRGVYMADDINIAKGYSGKDGGIVIVQVAQNTALTYRGDGIYLFEIPDAAPNQNYYEIDELIPVAVLDPTTHKRIR